MGQDSKAVDFLLAEYQEIYQEFRRLRQEGVTRLNFFITLTSVITGGLIILYQLSTTGRGAFEYLAIGSLLFLLIVGWDTVNFSISRDIDTDLNVRATARIRRFFADQYPNIEEYLTWQVHDEPTPWLTKNISNVRRTSQAIFAMLCASIAGLTVELFIQRLEVSLIVSAFVFLVAILVLQQYARWLYRRARNSGHTTVRFPKKSVKQETNN